MVDCWVYALGFFITLFLVVFFIGFYAVSGFLCYRVISNLNKEVFADNRNESLQIMVMVVSMLPFFNTLYCLYRFKLVRGLIKL